MGVLHQKMVKSAMMKDLYSKLNGSSKEMAEKIKRMKVDAESRGKVESSFLSLVLGSGKSSLLAVFFVAVELTIDSLATSFVNSCGSISLGVGVVAKYVCCRTSCEVDVVESGAGRISNGC
uniref:Uncharacterized protein n=1 Tax=Tanacetum cinerariifolium TaxID=118510 RepID=A0A699I4N0_TANCI|nr:hypothetical protein [Tanacetum cinerariifolium]